jgi:hypothetical protein
MADADDQAWHQCFAEDALDEAEAAMQTCQYRDREDVEALQRSGAGQICLDASNLSETDSLSG